VPITLTFDLEDNRRSPDQPARFVDMSERFLAFAADRGITATVYIVGEIGASHPELVRRVAGAGHEIGLHGLRHVSLDQIGPGKFQEEITRGRALLQDAAGVEVPGFRAPIFSLTPETAWARDELLAAGFSYSSSVLPAASPLHGWPGAPREPFAWGNGLVELPCPVIGRGRASIPPLGGVYLRYMPGPVMVQAARRLGAGDGCAWIYCHPYDFDAEEPFFVPPYAGYVTARILHARRGQTFQRITKAIDAAGGAGPSLWSVVQGLDRAKLPVVA
jgi:polysaccharide deacetylase family protein (PEP-CTERM system associated)